MDPEGKPRAAVDWAALIGMTLTIGALLGAATLMLR